MHKLISSISFGFHSESTKKKRKKKVINWLLPFTNCPLVDHFLSFE